MPRQPYVKDPNAPKPQVGRIIGELFRNYKKRLTFVLICLLFSSLAGSIASVFMNRVVAVIQDALEI